MLKGAGIWGLRFHPELALAPVEFVSRDGDTNRAKAGTSAPADNKPEDPTN